MGQIWLGCDHVGAGEIIIEEGSVGSEIFFLHEGQVQHHAIAIDNLAYLASHHAIAIGYLA